MVPIECRGKSYMVASMQCQIRIKIQIFIYHQHTDFVISSIMDSIVHIGGDIYTWLAGTISIELFFL